MGSAQRASPDPDVKEGRNGKKEGKYGKILAGPWTFETSAL